MGSDSKTARLPEEIVRLRIRAGAVPSVGREVRAVTGDVGEERHPLIRSVKATGPPSAERGVAFGYGGA